MSRYNDKFSRKKDITPLKEAFEELLQAYKLKDRFNERKVISAWGDLMGKSISKRTSQLYVREKILYVKLTSGPIKKELMMNKSKVLQIIGERFGNETIKDIVFL